MTAGSAAALLLMAERAGERLENLPEDLRPSTLAEGYAVQDEFARQWGAPTAGWKVGATSAGGRATLGVEHPLAGRLFSDRIFAPGDNVPLFATAMGVLEVELAFILGSTLTRRAVPRTRDEVAATVSSLHVAVELPETRFRTVASVGAPLVAADNACGGALVLGPPIPEHIWKDLDLSAIEGAISADGGSPSVGSGANVLGHPLDALLWLVQTVTERGLAVAEGEVVSTGSLTRPPSVSGGEQVLAELRGLAQVRFRLA
jgi:2-keto-4-pentenoate hydratase